MSGPNSSADHVLDMSTTIDAKVAVLDETGMLDKRVIARNQFASRVMGLTISDTCDADHCELFFPSVKRDDHRAKNQDKEMVPCRSGWNKERVSRLQRPSHLAKAFLPSQRLGDAALLAAL